MASHLGHHSDNNLMQAQQTSPRQQHNAARSPLTHQEGGVGRGDSAMGSYKCRLQLCHLLWSRHSYAIVSLDGCALSWIGTMQ